MRALTKLNQVGMVGRKPDGAPPEMPLEKIIRDPENLRPPLSLRTPDEQQRQFELNANIQKRGVKSPISLRPHPTLPDMWVINHGHCRYDAAEAAGFPTIPYFIDPNFDSYDQVAENLHRCDLSIWAIAAFIRRKLDEGQSKAQIAERLGKESQNYVTEHLALVDAPGCIHQAYANGVRSPRTLYDLRRAYDEFPEQVEEWCQSGARVTRDALKELLDGLRHDVTEASTQSLVVSPEQPLHRLTHGVSDGEATGQESQGAMDESGARGSLRHDVMLASRPDSQSRAAGIQSTPATPLVEALSSTGNRMPLSFVNLSEVVVVYRGRKARILSNTKVKIVVEGDIDPFSVALADLVFEGRK